MQKEEKKYQHLDHLIQALNTLLHTNLQGAGLEFLVWVVNLKNKNKNFE